jgi:hypothetical protein
MTAVRESMSPEGLAGIRSKADRQGVPEPEGVPFAPGRGEVRKAGSLGDVWDRLTGRTRDREFLPNSVRIHRQIELVGSDGAPLVIKAGPGRHPDGSDRRPEIPGVTFSQDTALCGEMSEGGVDVLLRRTELILALTGIGQRLDREPPPRGLGPGDIETLNKTPDCKPFRPLLLYVEAALKPEPDGPPRPKEPSLDGLVLANSRELGTGVLGLKVGQRRADLKLNQEVRFDSDGDPYGLSGITVRPGDTGQEVGLAIELTRRGESRNTSYDTTEACSGTRRVRICRDNGRVCETVEVTWNGRRRVTHTGTFRSDDYLLKLLGRDQAVAAEAAFSVLDSDDNRPVHGPCVEESEDRPRW